MKNSWLYPPPPPPPGDSMLTQSSTSRGARYPATSSGAAGVTNPLLRKVLDVLLTNNPPAAPKEQP